MGEVTRFEALLPDGRLCEEEETHFFGSSESQFSYRYTVDVSVLPRDYWGRVEGIAIRPVGSSEPFQEPPKIACHVSPSLPEKLKEIISGGWEKRRETDSMGNCYLWAADYLAIFQEVMQEVQSRTQKEQLNEDPS